MTSPPIVNEVIWSHPLFLTLELQSSVLYLLRDLSLGGDKLLGVASEFGPHRTVKHFNTMKYRA